MRLVSPVIASILFISSELTKFTYLSFVMAAKFAVKSLDHLVLTVRSIPETVAFYTTHLGMRHEVFCSPANPAVQRLVPIQTQINAD
jgi:hypothetical protein